MMVFTDVCISLVKNTKIKKRKAFDSIRSKSTYRLDQIVEDPDNRALYYLQDERAFFLYMKNSSIFQRILKYLLSGYLSGNM